MMDGWWSRFKAKRAAKKYARELGPRLRRGYGPSEFYAPAQIKETVRKLLLNDKYIVFGYAAYLPEDKFNALYEATPSAIGYFDARDLFFKFSPSTPFSVGGNPEASIDLVNSGGAFGDHHST